MIHLRNKEASQPRSSPTSGQIPGPRVKVFLTEYFFIINPHTLEARINVLSSGDSTRAPLYPGPVSSGRIRE